MYTLTKLRDAVNKSDMEEDVKSDLVDFLVDYMGYDEVNKLFDLMVSE